MLAGQRRLDARAADRPRRPGSRRGDGLHRPARAGALRSFRRHARQPRLRHLSNLAPNYDVAVFKDIGQAFRLLTTLDDLEQLSAEFAADVFSPSAFSPSAFSPGVFSPSVVQPVGFSPSAFSPSAFSPSAFSPSAFSPSRFIARRRSARRRSRRRRSRPSRLQPGAAYASAQIRSLIAVSASDGTANESITRDTWDNTGSFYVRVNGATAPSTPDAPFTSRVTADAGTLRRRRRRSRSRASAPAGCRPLADRHPHRPRAQMDGRRRQERDARRRWRHSPRGPRSRRRRRSRRENPRVAGLNAQADAHASCPSAKNLVAEAIKDIVDSYRPEHPGLQYVVARRQRRRRPVLPLSRPAGLGPESDYVPPVLDTSASQASLRRTTSSARTRTASQTDMSLEREHASRCPTWPSAAWSRPPPAISAMLDALPRRPGGVVPRPTELAGHRLRLPHRRGARGAGRLSPGSGPGRRAQGHADHRRRTSRRSDVGDPAAHRGTPTGCARSCSGRATTSMFLAGHFSANNALAADYATTIDSHRARRLAGRTSRTRSCSAPAATPATTSSTGRRPGRDACRSTGRRRSPQKGATLIAGTGYQYGDTDFLEYSERLYADFAHQLRLGTGPVRGRRRARARRSRSTSAEHADHARHPPEGAARGDALRAADAQRRPAGGRIPPADGVDRRRRPPARRHRPGRDARPALRRPVARRRALTAADEDARPTSAAPARRPRAGSAGPTASSRTRASRRCRCSRSDVSVPGQVLRGVGFRGATFTDPSRRGHAADRRADDRAAGACTRRSLRASSSRCGCGRVNYFGALARAPAADHALGHAGAVQGRRARLAHRHAAAVHAARPAALLQRRDTQAYARPARPNRPALAAPPAIARVDATVVGASGHVRVKVVGDPSAGIQEVWVTYSGVHAGKWESLDLQQSAGRLDALDRLAERPPAPQRRRRALHRAGRQRRRPESLDDNFGAYYRPGRARRPPRSARRAARGTSLVPIAADGRWTTPGPEVPAPLTSGGSPLAGQPVTLAIGGSPHRPTDAAGARPRRPVIDLPGGTTVSAAFDGDAVYVGRPYPRRSRCAAWRLAHAHGRAPTVGSARIPVPRRC